MIRFVSMRHLVQRLLRMVTEQVAGCGVMVVWGKKGVLRFGMKFRQAVGFSIMGVPKDRVAMNWREPLRVRVCDNRKEEDG